MYNYGISYNTHIVCTNASGYLAPEYAMRGHLTEKTDVYAFGIVALELVSGRKNSDVNLGNEKKYLLEWVCPCLLVKSLIGVAFIENRYNLTSLVYTGMESTRE